MADLPPPGKPTKGKADDTSGPSGDQHTTEHEEQPSARQILEQQKAGTFDLDRDFGAIKNLDHFRRLRLEYETMDDKLNRVSDFPPDSKTQIKLARSLTKAILNMESATDTKIKYRKPATKSEANASNDKQGSGNGNEQGEKDSVAVTFLKGLKLFEIELICWKVLTFSRDAQEKRLSRGAYGAQKTAIARFESWTARITSIRECLEKSKTLARQVIREGDPRIKSFVADPVKELSQVMHNRVNNAKRRDKKDAAENVNLSTPAETSAKGPPEALNSPHALDGGQEQKNVESSSTSADKQKQPSPVCQAHSAPQGNAQPANSTVAKGFLAPFEGGKKQTALPAPGPVKRSSKDDDSIPDDADFSTGFPPGPYRLVTLEEFSRIAASHPTSHDAANEPKPAFSKGNNSQAIAASIEKYRRRHQPRSRVSNESTLESANKELSHPVVPAQPSSENVQDPGSSYRFCPPVGGLSALKGPSSSAMPHQPSAAETQPPQAFGSPFSAGEGSSQNDTPATLDTRSLAKRQRDSPQAQNDTPPRTRGETATESHKRHKRDSSGSSMDVHVDDLEWEDQDYEVDDDDDDEDYEEEQ